MNFRALTAAVLASSLSLWSSANVAQTEPLKTAINPSNLANTTQYGFSQAAIASANARVVYIAGQIGISEDGPNDFESQVDRSFDNMIAVIHAAGAKVEDAVKITLLIKNHNDEKLKYLVAKRRSVFGDNPPASTLIPVTALALDAIEFEIDAVVVTSR